MAAAPYRRLAEARARSAGMVGQTVAKHTVIYSQNADLAAAELHVEAEVDPISFDAALWLVAEHVRTGQPVPEVLRKWGSDAITGKIARPKSDGKYTDAKNRRDRLILLLLDELVNDLGLKATSGNRTTGTSACHAVAHAFQLLKLQPCSYDSVVNIWSRGKELRTFSVPERV